MHISIVALRLSEPAREWWQKRVSARDIRRRALTILRMPDHQEVWPRYVSAPMPGLPISLTYEHNGNRQSNLVVRSDGHDYNLALDNLMTLDLVTLEVLNGQLASAQSRGHHTLVYDAPSAVRQGFSVEDVIDLSLRVDRS